VMTTPSMKPVMKVQSGNQAGMSGMAVPFGRVVMHP